MFSCCTLVLRQSVFLMLSSMYVCVLLRFRLMVGHAVDRPLWVFFNRSRDLHGRSLLGTVWSVLGRSSSRLLLWPLGSGLGPFSRDHRGRSCAVLGPYVALLGPLLEPMLSTKKLITNPAKKMAIPRELYCFTVPKTTQLYGSHAV